MSATRTRPRVVIDQRIAERRAEVRQQRRRRRLRRTLVVLGLAALVAGFVAIERSALVGLEEVEVHGTQRLDPAEVETAADLELGTSTLRLRLDDAADRVTALPLVQQAQARRLDPLTVAITVEEREPAVAVTADGVRWAVDREGVVLFEGAPDGLTAIATSGPPPEVGDRVDDHPALANAHEAWRSLSGPLRAQVDRYVAEGPDELRLELTSGIDVRFGRADRVDEKVRALGAVLADIGDAPVRTVDVRAPATPVVVGADGQQ